MRHLTLPRHLLHDISVSDLSSGPAPRNGCPPSHVTSQPHLEPAAAAEAEVGLRSLAHNIVGGVDEADMLLEPAPAEHVHQ
jgi:hypothetical protein